MTRLVFTPALFMYRIVALDAGGNASLEWLKADSTVIPLIARDCCLLFWFRFKFFFESLTLGAVQGAFVGRRAVLLLDDCLSCTFQQVLDLGRAERILGEKGGSLRYAEDVVENENHVFAHVGALSEIEAAASRLFTDGDGEGVAVVRSEHREFLTFAIGGSLVAANELHVLVEGAIGSDPEIQGGV